jgi:hypothetical protein
MISGKRKRVEREWVNLSMKKKLFLAAVLVFTISCALVFAQNRESYYVSAHGNDRSDGKSEATAFKTLSRAAQAAKTGNIKVITVIGPINGTALNEGELKNVDYLNSDGFNELLITGKEDAIGKDRAVINGRLGTSGSVRFTHITITGMYHHLLYSTGTLKLGAGVVITGSAWKGLISMDGGSIYIDEDAKIMGNKAGPGIASEGGFETRPNVYMSGRARISGNNGAGIMEAYTVTLSDNAEISNNMGGGIWNAETVTLSGNTRIANNSGEHVGGISLYPGSGSVTLLENATITGNKVRGTKAGGGVTARIVTLAGNAIIANNTAQGSGGGIRAYSVTLSGYSQVVGNISGSSGGGIWTEKLAILGNAVITSNTAKRGGGAFVYGESSMTGGVCTDNRAEYGAGMFIGTGPSYHQKGSFVLNGGSVLNNQAELAGGGVCVESGAVYNIQSGVLRDNRADSGKGADIFML